ncbi:LysM peptidoglycan-binding domain-containing protein [Lentilactobacillus kribbianus]|uniref:LysM peptidoglycan-binding domain-containing protein n=1 Tax=Lentilactobacillus kribbianus TaxID=2729622 RepID=UPI0015533BDE|nr:LysM peptidoglycan-binding domain-containing protein [Lentilactobacillus kribbianus]
MKKQLSLFLATATAALGLYVAGYTYADAATVTVKSGDTVAKLAADYNDTINGIKNRNNLADVNFIVVGQQLEVGEDTAKAATTSTPATAATTQSAPAATTNTNQNTQVATTNNNATQNTQTNTASKAASTTSNSSSNYSTGSHADVLSQMESRTGVSASTWNYIINRESNWQANVVNSTSGAYGLFQNMHISGGSVQDQIDAAVSLYHQQGMAAWAM